MAGNPPRLRRRRLLEAADADPDRPVDECPYERPFAEDFRDCPAYAARRFVPFDSLHRPLTPVWTCNFLAPRRAVDKAHGYYACCSLGTAEQRLAWLEQIRKDRLDNVVRLQRATAAVAEPYAADIYSAQVRQREPGDGEAYATADLHRLLEKVEAEVVAFIDAHEAEFEAAGLPVEACKQIMTLAIRDALEGRGQPGHSYVPPPALLERFPVEVRPLLFPSAAEA